MKDFEQIPLHWVNRIGFLVRRELTQRFAAHGYKISAEEWAVLLMLWQKDGRAPSELADLTFRDRTTITRLLDKMDKKDLVTRATDPQDRRKLGVFLTVYGQALEQKLKPIAQILIAKTLAGISAEEIEKTNQILIRMTENLLETEVPKKQKELSDEWL